jgi:hypothetical protein
LIHEFSLAQCRRGLLLEAIGKENWAFLQSSAIMVSTFGKREKLRVQRSALMLVFATRLDEFDNRNEGQHIS